jgi:hypothetical protein
MQLQLELEHRVKLLVEVQKDLIQLLAQLLQQVEVMELS